MSETQDHDKLWQQYEKEEWSEDNSSVLEILAHEMVVTRGELEDVPNISIHAEFQAEGGGDEFGMRRIFIRFNEHPDEEVDLVIESTGTEIEFRSKDDTTKRPGAEFIEHRMTIGMAIERLRNQVRHHKDQIVAIRQGLQSDTPRQKASDANDKPEHSGSGKLDTRCTGHAVESLCRQYMDFQGVSVSPEVPGDVDGHRVLEKWLEYPESSQLQSSASSAISQDTLKWLDKHLENLTKSDLASMENVTVVPRVERVHVGTGVLQFRLIINVFYPRTAESDEELEAEEVGTEIVTQSHNAFVALSDEFADCSGVYVNHDAQSDERERSECYMLLTRGESGDIAKQILPESARSHLRKFLSNLTGEEDLHNVSDVSLVPRVEYLRKEVDGCRHRLIVDVYCDEVVDEDDDVLERVNPMYTKAFREFIENHVFMQLDIEPQMILVEEYVQQRLSQNHIGSMHAMTVDDFEQMELQPLEHIDQHYYHVLIDELDGQARTIVARGEEPILTAFIEVVSVDPSAYRVGVWMTGKKVTDEEPDEHPDTPANIDYPQTDTVHGFLSNYVYQRLEYYPQLIRIQDFLNADLTYKAIGSGNGLTFTEEDFEEMRRTPDKHLEQGHITRLVDELGSDIRTIRSKGMEPVTSVVVTYEEHDAFKVKVLIAETNPPEDNSALAANFVEDGGLFERCQRQEWTSENTQDLGILAHELVAVQGRLKELEGVQIRAEYRHAYNEFINAEDLKAGTTHVRPGIRRIYLTFPEDRNREFNLVVRAVDARMVFEPNDSQANKTGNIKDFVTIRDALEELEACVDEQYETLLKHRAELQQGEPETVLYESDVEIIDDDFAPEISEEMTQNAIGSIGDIFLDINGVHIDNDPAYDEQTLRGTFELWLSPGEVIQLTHEEDFAVPERMKKPLKSAIERCSGHPVDEVEEIVLLPRVERATQEGAEHEWVLVVDIHDNYRDSNNEETVCDVETADILPFIDSHFMKWLQIGVERISIDDFYDLDLAFDNTSIDYDMPITPADIKQMMHHPGQYINTPDIQGLLEKVDEGTEAIAEDDLIPVIAVCVTQHPTDGYSLCVSVAGRDPDGKIDEGRREDEEENDSGEEEQEDENTRALEHFIISYVLGELDEQPEFVSAEDYMHAEYDCENVGTSSGIPLAQDDLLEMEQYPTIHLEQEYVVTLIHELNEAIQRIRSLGGEPVMTVFFYESEADTDNLRLAVWIADKNADGGI